MTPVATFSPISELGDMTDAQLDEAARGVAALVCFAALGAVENAASTIS